DDEEAASGNRDVRARGGGLQQALLLEMLGRLRPHAARRIDVLVDRLRQQRRDLRPGRLVTHGIHVRDVARDDAESAALGRESGHAGEHRAVDAHGLLLLSVRSPQGPAFGSFVESDGCRLAEGLDVLEPDRRVDDYQLTYALYGLDTVPLTDC